MSAVAAEDAAPVSSKKLSKKLIVIVAAVAVLLLGGGGAAFFVIKKQQAAAAEAEAEAEGEDGEVTAVHGKEAKKDEHRTPPTFVALDPFTINLADKEHERFGQIGVTLEVDDAHFAEEMKAYLPAIRAGILMILAHKTSEELLTREGKDGLAAEIMRESVRPMGIEIEPEAAAAAEEASGVKKKKKKAAVHNPVQRVLFSSFIIQ
ncbi:MAG: flagellar basal body-associated FliL family protein [Burkholderiales bacterium]